MTASGEQIMLHEVKIENETFSDFIENSVAEENNFESENYGFCPDNFSIKEENKDELVTQDTQYSINFFSCSVEEESKFRLDNYDSMKKGTVRNTINSSPVSSNQITAKSDTLLAERPLVTVQECFVKLEYIPTLNLEEYTKHKRKPVTQCKTYSVKSVDASNSSRDFSDSCERPSGRSSSHGGTGQKRKVDTEKNITNHAQFTCDFCGKSHKSQHLLKRHINIHNEGRPYKCSLCSNTFRTKSLLKNHLFTHETEKHFECEFCLEKFKRKNYVQKHIKKHHGPEIEKDYFCHICAKSFRFKQCLKRHLKTHNENQHYQCPSKLNTFKSHGKLHQCTICSFKSNVMLDFKIHMDEHYNETRPFKCETCSSTFKKINHLQKHIGTHSKTLPYECSVCQLKMKWKHSLTRHNMKYHAEIRPYQCQQCPSIFEKLDQFEVHIACHQKKRRFKCTKCGKSVEILLNQQCPNCSGNALNVCDVCKKSFKTKSILSRHMKSHDDSRPYQCSFCPQAYKMKANLKFHLGVHALKSQYVCEFCPASFKTKDSYDQHKMSHVLVTQGPITYQCFICKNMFPSLDQVKSCFDAHTAEEKACVVNFNKPL